MWADVLTKPKQGSGFRKDRAHLMNIPTNYDNDLERTRTPAKLLAFENKGATDVTTEKVSVVNGAKPIQHRRSVLGNARIVIPSRASNMRRDSNLRPLNRRPLPTGYFCTYRT